MLDKTSLDDKKILVLFNIEFLQVLVEERKINPENIYYIADNDLEYLSAIKIFKVQSYKLNDFSVPALKKLITGIDMKFDLVFSNPPYNGNVDIKILNEIVDVADEFVIVHPSTWVVDLKGKKGLYESFVNKINHKTKSLDLFNGNPVFNIGIFSPCVITHIDKNYNGSVKVKYFEENFESDNLSEVTKFSNKWNDLVSPFFIKIKDYVKNNSCLWNEKLEQSYEIQNDKFYVQLASIIGHSQQTGLTMLKDDFYTMVMKNSENNKGIRKKENINTFSFKNEFEQSNFINYLKTDFARFCLSFFKINANIHRGELAIVPWLDFTEEWDDEKLFKKFDVSQELQDYIREFLPDYYSIRK